MSVHVLKAPTSSPFALQYLGHKIARVQRVFRQRNGALWRHRRRRGGAGSCQSLGSVNNEPPLASFGQGQLAALKEDKGSEEVLCECLDVPPVTDGSCSAVPASHVNAPC